MRLDGTPSTPRTERSRVRGRRLSEAEQRVRSEVDRFLAEGLSVAQVARLAGCSESLVRKLRKLRTDDGVTGEDESASGGTASS